MPTSLTPPPKDDETECGNCGAYVYQGLLKCPNCGVYLIDPPDTEPEVRPSSRPKNKVAQAIDSLLRKLRGEPHVAEELFTGAMQEAVLFDDLLRCRAADRLRAEAEPQRKLVDLFTECDPALGTGEQSLSSTLEKNRAKESGAETKIGLRYLRQRKEGFFTND